MEDHKFVAFYLNHQKTILNFLGFWPLQNLRWHELILHQIHTILIICMQYISVVLESKYVLEVFNDLDEVYEFVIEIIQIGACCKVAIFISNKKNLLILLDLMRSDMFSPRNELHEKRLWQHGRAIRNLCTFIYVSATMAVILYAIIPLLDNTQRRILPFKFWVPFDLEKSLQYSLCYALEVMVSYINAICFIVVDSVTIVMIIFGCAQLEIITDKLDTLQEVPSSGKLKAADRHKRTKNNEIFKEIIQHHQALVRYIQILEDTYNWILFLQLGVTVGIICFVGLRITVVEPNSIQFMFMVLVMVSMLSQVFLPCWCGQELTIRSELLRERLYQCPWYEQDMKFKRSLWIVMERMKRPLIFRAGHYIPLSRSTFVSVLKTSYSYFAVLQQVNSK